MKKQIYPWFLLPLILFLLAQLGSIYFRLYHAPGPIGLDDSDAYIFRIDFFRHLAQSGQGMGNILRERIAQCDSSQDINNLKEFYGSIIMLPLGYAAALLNISSMDVFHANFYLGILCMAIVLCFIFCKYNLPRKSIAIGFLLFAFYTGQGNYHGFYWVVPSFFCIVFWLASFYSLFYSMRFWIFLPIFIFFLLFSHPSSLFGVAILIFSWFLQSIFRRNWKEQWTRPLVLILAVLIFLAIYSILIRHELIVPLFLEDSAIGTNASRSVIKMENVFTPTVVAPTGEMLSYLFGGYPKRLSIFYRSVHMGLYVLLLFPLTLWSVVKAYRVKEYPVLALFISCLILCHAMPLYSDKFAIRSFYFFEVATLLLYTIGLREAVIDIEQSPYFWTRKWTRPVFLLLLSLQGCFIVFRNLDLHLEEMLSEKVHAKRYIDTNTLKQFISSRDNVVCSNGGVENMYKFSTVDAGWNSNVICSSMTSIDSPKKHELLYAEENLKYYYTSKPQDYKRFGSSAVLLSGMGLVLDDDLSGNYQVILEDTGIPPAQAQVLQLQARAHGATPEPVWGRWEVSPLDVIVPLADELPFGSLLRPLVPLLDRLKKDYLVVRKNYVFTRTLEMARPGSLVLVNDSPQDIEFCGTLTLIQDGKIIRRIDLDRGATNLLRQIQIVAADGYRFPLPWTLPHREGWFELYENFWDLKIFRRYNNQHVQTLEKLRSTESVQERHSHFGVAKDLAPVAEGQVCRHEN